MNYGLYLSTAGALTSLHRQDVIANNLANINTVGFKPDAVYTQARLPERLESPGNVDPRLMLEQLGGGKFAHPTMTQFRQGQLTHTSNPLDVAIEGDGFFTVATGRNGASGEPHLTRDGRFALDQAGTLVTAAGGARVLDEDGQPIRIARGSRVTIDGDGTINADGATIARLQLVDVSDRSSLRKVGDNLYAAAAGTVHADGELGQLRQGYTEASAVNPVLTLNSMINATKAVQANAKMIQFHDDLMDKAINRFGRVA